MAGPTQHRTLRRRTGIAERRSDTVFHAGLRAAWGLRPVARPLRPANRETQRREAAHAGFRISWRSITGYLSTHAVSGIPANRRVRTKWTGPFNKPALPACPQQTCFRGGAHFNVESSRTMDWPHTCPALAQRQYHWCHYCFIAAGACRWHVIDHRSGSCAASSDLRRTKHSRPQLAIVDGSVEEGSEPRTECASPPGQQE